MGSAPAPRSPRRRRRPQRQPGAEGSSRAELRAAGPDPALAPILPLRAGQPQPPRAGSSTPGPLPRERSSAAQRQRRGLLPGGRSLLLAGAGLALLWFGRHHWPLWLSHGRWLLHPPPPQMILVLGGDVERERRAAQLARQDALPVLVSGGSNPEYARWLFQEQEGLPSSRLRLDYRAIDTLSNFTSLVDELQRARIHHALLVTSSDHMPRALLVGRIVAGSRGIHLTPVAVPCGQRCEPEGRRRIWGDGLRAMVWVVSGRDLRHWAEEHLAPWLEPDGGAEPGPPPASG